MLQMEASKCWEIGELTKISIKMKSCKIFYEAKKTSRINEIIQPPLPTQASSNKILLRLFLQSASRMQFWASRNGGVIKCFFWDQTRTCLLENFY